MKQPSLKKNYLYRVFYEILILITPFITTPYISRILGADGIGDYSFTHSVISYFMLFGALGTASYGTKVIAQARNDNKRTSQLFWEIELITVATTGICMLIWSGFILFGGKYSTFYLALMPFLFSTMFDISWYFTGLELIRNIVIRNSVVRIIGIVLIFAFIKEKDDLLLYCLINSGTALLGNLSMWLYLPKMLVRVDPRKFVFKSHFHETLVYFIPTIATSVYMVLDKTLIGAITGDNYQNGYYEQASKVIKIVKSIAFVAVNSIMTARMSYLFSEKKFAEIREKIEKSMDFILLLCVGAVFGLLGISQKFVPVFFGPGYEPVVGLTNLMSPLIIIIGISNCLGAQYYTPSGKRAQSSKYIISGAIVNLILNLCLIPVLSAKGAIIASLIAETVITGLYLHNCDRYITVDEIWKKIWKRLIAGILMFCAVFALGKMNWNSIAVLIIQAICGGAVYCTILFAMKDRMLLEFFKTVFSKFKNIEEVRENGESTTN